jgi:hypothetical protein
VKRRARATLAALAFVVGCASSSLQTDPAPAEYRRADLRYFVENHGQDQRRLDQIIVRELGKRGLAATSGFSADRPEHFDVLVVYEDRWQWDMSNYLIHMRIDLRNPTTNQLLAMGSSYQTSLARKEPEAVIAKILTGMFP